MRTPRPGEPIGRSLPAFRYARCHNLRNVTQSEDLRFPPLPDARWSVSVREVVDGRARTVFEHTPELVLRTASIGKLYLLIELAAQIEDGRVDPAMPLSRTGTVQVADSGLWHSLITDTLPVGDVARLVGAVSDNLATNVLIDLVGLDAVSARTDQIAPGGSALLDHVRNERGPELPWTLSVGCAADLVEIASRLEAGTLVSPAVDARVIDWLGSGVDHSLVPAILELDTLVHIDATDETPVWNKTGAVHGVRGDVGVVRHPGRTVVYAALCNWDEEAARAEGLEDGGIGRLMQGMRMVGELVR